MSARLNLNLIQARHLARLERGDVIDTAAWPAAQVRAYMVTRNKLTRWGIVRDNQITAMGKAALAAFRKQYPEHNV